MLWKESRKGCVGSMGKGRNSWSKPRPNADSLERSVMILDARGNGNGEISPTLTGDHQNRITDYTAIVVEVRDESDADRKEVL